MFVTHWPNIFSYILIVSFLVYLYLKKRFRYWANKKVPYVEPKSLLFGSNLDMILGRVSFQQFHATLYDQLAPHPFGGYYYFQRPLLLIRDPELVKHVLSLDFEAFADRHVDADETEPLRLNLFNLRGEQWKLLREKITPAFTPAKIRLMVDLMKECADELVNVLREPAETGVDIFVSDVVARYGTDVISTCAFGFRANTLQNPNAVFALMTKKIVQPHTKYKFRSLLLAMSPKLCTWLKIRMFNEEAYNYFITLVDETMKYREKNNVQRNDFIDLLIAVRRDEEAANAKDKNRTGKLDTSTEFLAAHCFAFFFAGYATQNLTLSAGLLELARNPEVQTKLRAEIDENFEKEGGKITYDALKNMKYLEQVILETVRNYPGQPILLRTCTKDYKIPNTDVIIEKDTTVLLPRYGLNHDKAHYAEPFTFNPEHFSDEAKANRHQYAHLLFGDGPRKCIGMRFGLMHSKLALTMLLRNYEFTLSPKMKFPLKYSSNVISTSIVGGIWLRCRKRPQLD